MSIVVRPLRRHLAAFSLAGLIGLLMLPNLIWASAEPRMAVWLMPFALAVTLLLCMFAVFGRRIWLACLLLAPFALLSPAETYYIAQYSHPSVPEILASIIATNPHETVEYFGQGLLAMLLSMFGGLVLALVAAWSTYRAQLTWRHRSREWIRIGVIALPIAIFTAGAVKPRNPNVTGFDAGFASLEIFRLPFRNSYPFGTVLRLVEFHEEWEAMYTGFAAIKSFRFHAAKVNAVGSRQIYVLAIGESSRRDHWQIFGYRRPTNPELTHIRNLVPITDMLSSWSQSLGAIPRILVRQPLTDPHLIWKDEASILRAMQEAGYDTWWISNQVPIGEFDSPVAMHALEATHALYLNRATYMSAGNYDENLLEPFRDVLKKSDRDVFVVLHMMGSHLTYDLRYPSTFKHFRPTAAEYDESALPRERIINSYDNTILYTDHVLAQVIDILRSTNAITALWFESDHGETLPNSTCNAIGHGFDTRFDFQIPALFWFSDAYDAVFSQRIAALRSHVEKPTLSANTFESMIDMAGITFPSHDASWSLFSPNWRQHPRLIHLMNQDTYEPAGVVDYDQASFDDACEHVLLSGEAPTTQ
jgi:glucan phosphoethanolaminetransferase (alkaline phosphatase superfamily)